MNLVAAKAFDVRTSLARKFSVTPVDIDPQTATLSVTIPRPTTPAQASVWPATTKVALRVGIEVDGKRTGAEAVISGGLQFDKKGNLLTQTTLNYNVETGFYGPDRDDPAEWATLFAKRLGETGTVVKAWAEVEILNGDRVVGTLAVDGIASAVQSLSYHHSVAIENYTSAGTTSATTSLTISSFTANSGTNRIAFVHACGNASPTVATSQTYGGSSPSLAAVYDGVPGTNSFDDIVLAAYTDSEIGSGAKNIAASWGSDVWGLLSVVVCSGVDQTTPAQDVQSQGWDTGGGTTMSTTHTVGTSDEFILAFKTTWDADPTPAANQTEIINAQATTGVAWITVTHQVPTTDLTPSFSWSGGNEASLVSFTVNAAGGAATAVKDIIMGMGYIVHAR